MRDKIDVLGDIIDDILETVSGAKKEMYSWIVWVIKEYIMNNIIYAIGI